MKCRRKLLPAVWTECGGLEPGKVDELVWAPGKRGRGMSRRNFTGSALANEGIHCGPGDEIAAATLSRLGCWNQSNLARNAARPS